jgi:hypothetical protein
VGESIKNALERGALALVNALELRERDRAKGDDGDDGDEQTATSGLERVA